jgi:hypothetical protein
MSWKDLLYDEPFFEEYRNGDYNEPLYQNQIRPITFSADLPHDTKFNRNPFCGFLRH